MLCNRVVPCSSHFISSFHATGTETYPSSSGGCSLQRGCSRTLRLWCCRTSGAVFPAPLPFADAYIYIYDIYIYMVWEHFRGCCPGRFLNPSTRSRGNSAPSEEDRPFVHAIEKDPNFFQQVQVPTRGI